MTVLDGRTPARPTTPNDPRTSTFALVVGLGLALLLLSLLPAPLRVLSLPLALFVPGYAVCSALIGPDRPAQLPTRIALWVVTSLSAPTVVGLLLGLPRREFDRVTVLAAHGIVVLAAAAWIARQPHDARDTTGSPMRPEASVRPTLVAAGLASIVSIVVLGVFVQINRPAIEFTTATIDGIEPEAPLAFPADGEARIPIVLGNETGETVVFRLDPGIDGVPDRWAPVEATVAPGQRWTGEIRGPVPTSGCLQRLSVRIDENGTRSRTGPLSRWIAPKPGVLCVRHPTTTTPGA